MNYLSEILKSLSLNSNDAVALNQFVSDNMNDLYELDNHCHLDCKQIMNDLDSYIKTNHNIISELNYNNENNKIFILILSGLCERFGKSSSLRYLLNIIEKKQISVPLRIKASQIYLYNIESNDQYISSLESICQLIQNSILFEETDPRISIYSFLNYYYYVFRNIPHNRGKLRKAIIDLKKELKYDFLQEKIITELLLEENDLPDLIAKIIDNYLSRSSFHAKGYTFFVIEENTNYQQNLEFIEAKSFNAIRELSLNMASGTHRPESRGCNPITDDKDLYLYMRSYGNMHYAKICDALAVIPCDVFNQQNIEVISWGCGQGIETIALLEKTSSNNISSLTLIEPSDIALKRASLHAHNMQIDKTKIKTICKYINDLTSIDILSEPNNIKLHLLSNILDIPTVSLSYLTQLICSEYKGVNYFICVSPYERIEKAQRLEQFKKNFEELEKFTVLKDEIITKEGSKYWNCNNYFQKRSFCYNHPLYCNGKNKWTRITKVFSVYL